MSTAAYELTKAKLLVLLKDYTNNAGLLPHTEEST